LFYKLWQNRRGDFGPGFMCGLFCVLLFIERFLDEFVKENQEVFENSMALNMGQILSIPFILVGIYLMWNSKRLKNKHSENNFA
jgi:phosphatidylglycerol---prolipoprotein diacylglyceryl transferase